MYSICLPKLPTAAVFAIGLPQIGDHNHVRNVYIFNKLNIPQGKCIRGFDQKEKKKEKREIKGG